MFSVQLEGLEVKDGVPWRAKLHQNHRRFFDCDVPVVLQVENQFPNLKTHESTVSLEEGEMFMNLYLSEVIRQPAERAKNV